LGKTIKNRPLLSKWGILSELSEILNNKEMNPGFHSFITLLKTDFANFCNIKDGFEFEHFCGHIEILLRNFVCNNNDLFCTNNDSNKKNQELMHLYKESYGVDNDKNKIMIEKGYTLSNKYSMIIPESQKSENFKKSEKSNECLFDHMTKEDFKNWEKEANIMFQNIQRGFAYDFVCLDRTDDNNILISFIEIKKTIENKYPKEKDIKSKLMKMNDVFIKIKEKFEIPKLKCRAIFYTTLEKEFTRNENSKK
jgi:hypothetical protein